MGCHGALHNSAPRIIALHKEIGRALSLMISESNDSQAAEAPASAGAYPLNVRFGSEADGALSS